MHRRLQDAQAEEQTLADGIRAAQLECDTSNRCLAELTRVSAAAWGQADLSRCPVFEAIISCLSTVTAHYHQSEHYHLTKGWRAQDSTGYSAATARAGQELYAVIALSS